MGDGSAGGVESGQDREAGFLFVLKLWLPLDSFPFRINVGKVTRVLWLELEQQ